MKDFFGSFVQTTFKLKHVVMASLVIGIYVLSGPFGTYAQLSLLERITFWVPLGVLAFGVGGFSCAFAMLIYNTDRRLPHGLLSAFLFAMLFAPINYFFIRNEVTGPPDFYMPFWQVLLVNFSFACALVIWVFLNDAEQPNKEQQPRLYARLPVGTVGKISHMTVDDHYTVVCMEDGTQQRILMRFADAVKEMDETHGFLTHRSHWVALEFVKDSKRVGNKDFVSLASGHNVPVSKTYRETLVAAGFFQEA